MIIKVDAKDKQVIRHCYKVQIKYLYTKIPEEIFYDCTIDFKDGKCRCTIDSFELVSQGMQNFDFYDRFKSQGKGNKKIYTQATNKVVQEIFNSLTDALKNGIEKEDW